MKHISRRASIDCFRGFAVLVRVLVSYLFGTEALPAWLRHAPDGSLTVVDLGAPLFFWVFHLLADRLHWHPSWLVVPGKNSLLIYLLQYVLLGTFFLPGIPWWYVQAPLWLIVVQATALLAAVLVLARFLERRDWILSL